MRDDPVSRIADIKKVNAVLARTREKFITAKEPDYKSMPKKDRPAASKAFHIEWMRQYKELKPLVQQAVQSLKIVNGETRGVKPKLKLDQKVLSLFFYFLLC